MMTAYTDDSIFSVELVGAVRSIRSRVVQT